MARLGVLVLAYGLLNVVLYFGQELLAMDDEREAKALEQELIPLADELDELEASLDSFESLSMSIDALGERLDSMVEPHLSDSTVVFNDLVMTWNEEAVPELLALEERYEQVADEYSDKYDQYEPIARKAYNRWWLLPIPLPRGGGRAIR